MNRGTGSPASRESRQPGRHRPAGAMTPGAMNGARAAGPGSSAWADGDDPDQDHSAEPEPPLVVGFGEALLRLTAQGHVPLEYASALTVDVGGTELNMLVALAQFGCRTRWVSRLPSNPFGRRIASHARRHGVDLAVEWDDDARAGLYFVEEGAQPRPTQVLYDRTGSAASRLAPGMVDWPRVLRSAAVLHCSGITCALGAGAEKAVLEALESAAAARVMTSFDINYRSQLWDRAAAAAAFRRILPRVNILFASPFDLALITGGEPDDQLADQVRQEFGLDLVVVRTQQQAGHGAVRVNVSIVGGEQEASGTAEATVLDAFGAGDVAAAAFLAGLLAKDQLAEVASAAARSSAHMYTLPGDTWLQPSADFDGNASLPGRINR